MTIGTCAVPVTGDWQKWTTATCNITPATGTHNIYLVYTGNDGYLFNIEWFVFRPVNPYSSEASGNEAFGISTR
jgi:hypothetical protein